MERVMSVEEKIKRAEEIYYRKKQNQDINYTRVSVKTKKDYKIFRKMTIQIIVCVIIYFIFYYITNNDFVFSQDFTEKSKEVLSKDINFGQIYDNTSNYIIKYWNKNSRNLEDKNENDEQNYNSNENDNIEIENKDVNLEKNQQEIEKMEQEIINKEQNSQQVEENLQQDNLEKQNVSIQENKNIGGAEEGMQELSQMEKDCIDIKNITSFIVPVQGYISSSFGWRDPTTESVPKNHTGLDLAAVTGSEIKSATNGTVILASTEGDYGKHLKIQIEDVIMVYAHCNVLCVKEGDYVTQGQKIAEVGSTGNSTGPHLHFEIRKSERLVDPQMILDI